MQGRGGIVPEVTELVDGPEEAREDASHLADDGRLAETSEGEEPRKEAKRKRDLDESGQDLKGTARKPSRQSKAEKRRVEEEESALEIANIEKALRASRESQALKRRNENEDRRR